MWHPAKPVEMPRSGRVFSTARRVRLGDVTPKGRLRLDAIARYLQDVANDDAVNSKYSDIHGWVVRRTEMWVQQFPVYMTDVSLTTWCGGYGSHWAERRTSISSSDGSQIEVAALWVHVDMKTMKPSPLPEDFLQMAHEASAGRKMRGSLLIGRSLPPLDTLVSSTAPWVLRFADMDAVGHMNNAAYWIAVEEYLSTHADARRTPLHATVEHHLAIDQGDDVRIVIDELGDRIVLRHVLRDNRVAAVAQLVPL